MKSGLHACDPLKPTALKRQNAREGGGWLQSSFFDSKFVDIFM